MMISHKNGELQFSVFRVYQKTVSALQCHKHCHFRNAVEVNIILTDKLVDLSLVRAPEVPPFLAVVSI